MTFKIHQVYKQNVSKKTPSESEQSEQKEQQSEQSSDPQNLSLSSTDSNASKTPKSLQQMRNDVLNSRSSVKPGTKNGIRPTAFEGGLEADMY
jgi:hypothetical protein